MANTVQINVRLPEEAREVMLRLASRLRDDPSALDALERFVDGLGPIGGGLTLSERVARLEAIVAKMGADDGRKTR